MPLLFAVTLFISASLMFMVQPMVGKMVLPLLGGSPAVWNACMVFFQALLLLGYLYAHKLVEIESPRRQWMIHLLVLSLPVLVFTFAAIITSRHTPIAIVESLAPSDESSPILSVLSILTIAIGIPFFVVSTTATLLQRWFVYTGHPSARDPYFLYAASNLGSLISLLGYPLIIEPRMPIVGQGWLFAIGFLMLFVMIYFCGRAAANPIGVPPSGRQPDGNGENGIAKSASQVAAVEPPPVLARKLKWIALAFVPSTFMLGVTFHMTTDIASIPLLWVGPLTLYLLTFIIAFGTIRGLVQLAILLPAGFCFIVGLMSGTAILLAPALLLAGVFTGLYFANWLGIPDKSLADSSIFRIIIGNLAPVMLLLLVFVLISGVNPGVGITLGLHMLTFFAAALMCHYELARDRPAPQYLTGFFLLMSVGGVLGGIFNSLLAPLVFPHAYEYPLAIIFACLMVPVLTEKESKTTGKLLKLDAGIGALAGEVSVGSIGRLIMRWIDSNARLASVLDFVIPVLIGVGFYYFARLTESEKFASACASLSQNTGLSLDTIRVILLYAVPVMICFFFVDRPLRFALCVAAILGPITYREASNGLVHSERSFFGILKVTEDDSYQFIRREDGSVVRHPGEDSEPIVAGRYKFRKLVHGTTLHGTQIVEHDRHFLDDFQMLALGANPWDSIVIAGATKMYEAREEPLTYYHRSGPVGAMFAELRRRKGGTDANAHFAMVGLGTGSVSCYARPGQKITFYEIDPAVKHMVADTDEYFSYVTDARKRGAELDLRMGDARLKLKDDVDRKYSLLLVDAFSSDSIPVHLLTVEAVKLYLDRMTDDGILALHISNKYVRLEPVVAQIAAELGLTARVWNDDAERKPGKTASSWIVLARKPEHLGQLYSETGDLIFGPPAKPGEDDRMEVTMDSQLFQGLANDFEELREIDKKKAKYLELNELPKEKVKEAWLEWAKDKLTRTTDPFQKRRLEQYIDLMDRYSPFFTFQEVMTRDHGHAYRRVETMAEVPAWTDDYSDVMRVMMIPELQKVRKFFGLPTPVER